MDLEFLPDPVIEIRPEGHDIAAKDPRAFVHHLKSTAQVVERFELKEGDLALVILLMFKESIAHESLARNALDLLDGDCRGFTGLPTVVSEKVVSAGNKETGNAHIAQHKKGLGDLPRISPKFLRGPSRRDSRHARPEGHDCPMRRFDQKRKATEFRRCRKQAPSRRAGLLACAGLYFILLLGPSAALGCGPRMITKEASPEEIRGFFETKKMRVLTFLGYSAAEYEDKELMLKQAERILDQFDPANTIVNIGATAEGIGAVYETAKRKGFLTAGIVSTQARDSNAALAPCVDVVFYVRDATWGGFLPGTGTLSPTSKAIVENSDVMVAIGGGEVARDELSSAKKFGKQVRFFPADMNHQIAREKALRKNREAPSEFGGAAASAFLAD